MPTNQNDIKPPKGAGTLSGSLKRSAIGPGPGAEALESYAAVLEFLGDGGRPTRPHAETVSSDPALLFMEQCTGLSQLYESMCAVAPAVPGASDEEWNPLSQRPHAPLPPVIPGDELGSELTSLKEAVDAFTTLSHEMMHVALWEPFFSGRWKPQNRGIFVEFSLLAEGFCFFFTDILVSGTVRVRLPDGEFALERQSPSNARFHPVRAFQALGIDDPSRILDIYLEGFRGQKTALWQPRGTSDVAASLAAQAYHFYSGSLGYLSELYRGLSAFGGISEFYRRFCLIPGLPSIQGEFISINTLRGDFKPYFEGFYNSGMQSWGAMTAYEVQRVRWRRRLQMRAYYGLQVRWLLQENHLAAAMVLPKERRRLLAAMEVYLDGLRALLLTLASRIDWFPDAELTKLDTEYDRQVRTFLIDRNVWVGHRWLIAPRRAGGCISLKAFGVQGSKPVSKGAIIGLVETVGFLVDELNQRLGGCKKKSDKIEILAQIQRLAALGAAVGSGSQNKLRQTFRSLVEELAQPHLLEIWSLPLGAFSPVDNRFRELVFSYQ